MKKILVTCPDEHPTLGSILGGSSLSLSLFLGKSLLEHALDELVLQGAEEVWVVAGPEAAQVRSFVRGGEAWGMQVEVLSENRFFNAMTILEWRQGLDATHVTSVGEILGLPGNEILERPSGWHEVRGNLLAKLVGRQVGVRKHRESVWVGARASVDEAAILRGPCWIGHGASVRADAVVGPNAFVEEGALVDRGAIVENSTITARTYLGEMMHLQNSIAGGPILYNCQNGSSVEVTDPFFLGHTRGMRLRRMREKIRGVFALSNQNKTTKNEDRN